MLKSKTIHENINNTPPIGVMGPKTNKGISTQLLKFNKQIEKQKKIVPKSIKYKLLLRCLLNFFLLRQITINESE